jgi:hypothetical protein
MEARGITQLGERQNGAGYFDRLILPVITPSISLWLSLRSIKNIVVVRASCKSASSPGRLSGCPGMRFDTSTALLDCDVPEHMLRDYFAARRHVTAKRDLKAQPAKAVTYQW